ncbi:hypothetical protein PoB_002200500 [Plakobranchus ocellatus]|uniref:Secreted protein n=1 Tax=Plakobranchus ocellatus TaxID=259542 RepID=A0AAV3ZLP9_9GAST|nr:hypothetical protein PoB_002200500 [Plakobranchus ocellatus]
MALTATPATVAMRAKVAASRKVTAVVRTASATAVIIITTTITATASAATSTTIRTTLIPMGRSSRQDLYQGIASVMRVLILGLGKATCNKSGAVSSQPSSHTHTPRTVYTQGHNPEV